MTFSLRLPTSAAPLAAPSTAIAPVALPPVTAPPISAPSRPAASFDDDAVPEAPSAVGTGSSTAVAAPALAADYFDAQAIYVQNPGKEWSYGKANGVSRFELRAGDKLASEAAQRSEIAAREKLEVGQAYHIEFSVMIEPGAKNTAAWMTLFQIQSTFDPGESHSPALALEMVGDKMRIVSRASSALISPISDNTTYTAHYTDKADVTRGHWYNFSINVKFDPFGEGQLDVYRDGVLLTHYEGALGYNDVVGPYLKQGAYRSASPETIAVNFKDTSVVLAPDNTPNLAVAESTSSTVSTVVSALPGVLPQSLEQVTSAARLIAGDAAANTLTGTSGADRFVGGLGKDILRGGAGSDTADYSEKTAPIDVVLKLDAAATVHVNGAIEDTLYGVENVIGGSGADTVIGDRAANAMFGGAGGDFFMGGGGADAFDGGDGVDTVSYQDKRESVVATLAGATPMNVYVGGIAEDVIVNVENIMGGAGGDRLTGDAKANLIRGLAGDDTLYGGAGTDTLYGDSGNDTLVGGDQYDVLIGGLGADTLTGGNGFDNFRFTAVSDSLPTAMDRITDYQQGDTIDLSLIDANVHAADDQAFVVVQAFTKTAGEMVFSSAGGVTTLLGDVNGDGAADIGIVVLGSPVTSTQYWLL